MIIITIIIIVVIYNRYIQKYCQTRFNLFTAMFLQKYEATINTIRKYSLSLHCRRSNKSWTKGEGEKRGKSFPPSPPSPSSNFCQNTCNAGSYILTESFHLSGHTFRFRWTVQDLEVFLVQSNSPLAAKGLNLKNDKNDNLLSNSLSNVQITHSNVQITSTNIQ